MEGNESTELKGPETREKVTVMATGVFDILHLGHVHYLQESRNLGDRLVVVVANDETVRKFKHEPITPQEMRLELIKSLRVVDEAYIGHRGDAYRIVRELEPDIIALGYDQHHDPDIIRSKIKALDLKTKVVRLPKFDHDLDGTRKIINKIIKERCVQTEPDCVEGKDCQDCTEDLRGRGKTGGAGRRNGGGDGGEDG